MAVFSDTVSSEDPLVTLQHGGTLRGKWINFNDKNNSVFLGIPYAKPPVGDLRFKKPQPAEAWTGERNATSYGDKCVQYDFSSLTEFAGSEDCLYLQVNVPGEVNETSRKPVMVYMHGGGYIIGSANTYIGVPLSVFGDVIVVTINYRLGAFGFLREGPGTGNFGLWDQRQALVWVKENIASFGGDPEMVTIFGQSAGAGSVSALTLSKQADGLFKRAIMQSGTLFAPWSWYISTEDTATLHKKIKQRNNCQPAQSVYECLSGKTSDEVMNGTDFIAERLFYRPTADNDFFPNSFTDENYNATQKYDILAGFNGQEGGLSFNELEVVANSLNTTLRNGTSLEMLESVLLPYVCSTMVPNVAGLCQYFITKEYKLNDTIDDEERIRRLIDYYGDYNFGADAMNMLNRHSTGSSNTYAYTFTELYQLPENLSPWFLPEWLKTSADHADELRFVHGVPYLRENDMIENYYGVYDEEAQGLDAVANYELPGERELSLLVMKMWTNFARTGDPNTPQPLNVPTWPQYDVMNKMTMDINSNDTRVVELPNSDRLGVVLDTVHEAVKSRYQDRNSEIQSDE